jgi:hypothetical protein
LIHPFSWTRLILDAEIKFPTSLGHVASEVADDLGQDRRPLMTDHLVAGECGKESILSAILDGPFPLPKLPEAPYRAVV